MAVDEINDEINNEIVDDTNTDEEPGSETPAAETPADDTPVDDTPVTVSDLTVAMVKNYLRVDTTADDSLLALILAAAKRFCAQYTGLSTSELDNYEDMPLAVLAVCADMYEVRQVTLNGTQINPVTAQILGTYSTNLLPTEGGDADAEED